jgi:alkylation response protein AidB-like acyl-CoA dehydrogenase
MLTYNTPVDDIRFLLGAFGYNRVSDLETYRDFDLDTMEMMVEESGRFYEEVVLPTNEIGDREHVQWDPETHEVTTPEAFKEAYDRVAQNGYIGITTPTEYGGAGAPETLGVILTEIASATNKSLGMFGLLSTGLIRALEANGSEEQQETYIPKLASGEWGGTMALTEPHAGTDLGLIRTKAEPNDDGTYDITGRKIWITAGEHDLTDNIVHFVLARLPDAPEGTKGISVFLVPKYLEDGERNDVECVGLEEKMGIHGSPTCEMEFDGATGYLVDEPNKGMRSMFVMMNEARLKVGIEGVALSNIAYQTALSWAKDREQSRALDEAKRDPDKKADNILVHPDVRRMLASVKSSVEAMRGLVMWAAVNLDLSDSHPDDEVRQEAQDLVDLLTPIIKAYCTEQGFENVSEAMQVCGGAGYTRDMHIEQYLRDMRIAMIYEGTNHIQALDLVGRKLTQDDGRLYRLFQSRVTDLITSVDGREELEEFVEPLKDASKTLTDLTMRLGQKAAEDREQAGAVANNYLTYFALTAMAYGWVRQLKYAVDEETENRETKFKTARFWFNHILPERHSLEKVIASGKEHMMAFNRDEF